MSVVEPKSSLEQQRLETQRAQLFTAEIKKATEEREKAKSELEQVKETLKNKQIGEDKRRELKQQESEKEPLLAEANRKLASLRVMQEIYNTELTYSKDICYLSNFVQTNKAVFEKTPDGQKLLAAIQKINEIMKMSDTLLAKLVPPPENIASVFKDQGAKFLAAYQEYVVAYNEMGELLQKCKKNKQSELAQLIENFRTQPESSGKDLPSFLIMPVQRIPRYALLLNELYKYNPQASHFSGETGAIAVVKQTATFINEAIRQAENFAALSKRNDSPESRKARSMAFDAGGAEATLKAILSDKQKLSVLQESLRTALKEPNLTIDQKGVVRIGDKKFKIVQGGVQGGNSQQFYVRVKKPRWSRGTIGSPEELAKRQMKAREIGAALSKSIKPQATETLQTTSADKAGGPDVSVATVKTTSAGEVGAPDASVSHASRESMATQLQHLTAQLEAPPHVPSKTAEPHPPLVTQQALQAGRAALKKSSGQSPAPAQQSEPLEFQRKVAEREARRAANAAPSASAPNPAGPKPATPPRRRP